MTTIDEIRSMHEGCTPLCSLCRVVRRLDEVERERNAAITVLVVAHYQDCWDWGSEEQNERILDLSVACPFCVSEITGQPLVLTGFFQKFEGEASVLLPKEDEEIPF